MTLTDQERRDRIDAAAATLDDIGMPTLAARLRETADELLPTDHTTAPVWSPVVGGWAEHRRYGRVLVAFVDTDETSQIVGANVPSGLGDSGYWVANCDLSAPVPRVWESAEDVPVHVVVTDRFGSPWPGTDLHSDLAPFTEVLPVGGVW